MAGIVTRQALSNNREPFDGAKSSFIQGPAPSAMRYIGQAWQRRRWVECTFEGLKVVDSILKFNSLLSRDFSHTSTPEGSAVFQKFNLKLATNQWVKIAHEPPKMAQKSSDIPYSPIKLPAYGLPGTIGKFYGHNLLKHETTITPPGVWSQKAMFSRRPALNSLSVSPNRALASACKLIVSLRAASIVTPRSANT